MQLWGRWSRWLSCWLLAGLLGAGSGCLSCLHPVGTPGPELVEACHCLPKCCRDHVYVFLMNGLDLTGYGNLAGLRDYLLDLGICRTYYGQLHHACWFVKEIRRLHREDPDARFVLIGFSFGADMVHAVARAVEADDVHFDLMVLLSCNHPFLGLPHDRPKNVGKVINILAGGRLSREDERPWAENVRLCDAFHFGPPTHPATLRLVAHELAEVITAVPVPALPEVPPQPAVEEAPTPRPVKPRTSARRDDWDFLKPVDHLGGEPEASTGGEPLKKP